MENPKKLLITNLKEDIFHGDIDSSIFAVYNFNQGTVNRSSISCINDAKKLHKLALEKKDDFADFIYSHNQEFLDNELVFNNNLSLYFISIFSNKRSEFFSTYSDYLHQLILKDILKKNIYESIYAIGFSDEELDQLRKNLKNDIKLFDFKQISRRKSYNFFKLHLFYISSFIYLSLIRLFFRKTAREVNQFFYAQYPKHFTLDLLHKKYGKLDSSDTTFMLTLMSDGFHQSLKPSLFIKTLFKLRKIPSERYILLDLHLKWIDIFKALISFYNYKKKLVPLMKVPFIFNSIDLSFQIKKELKLSLHQIPRVLMYYNAYLNVFKMHNPKKVVYYLHEFVSGRFISYILNTYFPNIKSTGFQHGPIAKRKLLYALSSTESNGNNYLLNVPLPKYNICESEESKKIYASYGYKNLKVQKNIERLNYLTKIKRNQVLSNSCLLAGGLHDSDQILQYAIENKIYRDKKVWLKLHPQVNKERYEKLIKSINHPNLILANKDLSFYLSKVEVVLVTYSSVGEEALKLEIETLLLAFGYRVNESPLLDNFTTNKLLNILYV